MIPPEPSAPIPIASFDPYSSIPSLPTHPHPQLLPHGVMAFGMLLAGTPSSAEIPAFAEYTIGLQLERTTVVKATVEHTYEYFMRPGDLTLVPYGVPVRYHVHAESDSNVLLLSLPPCLLQATAERDLDWQAHHTELRLFMSEKRDALLHGIGSALQSQFQAEQPHSPLYVESLIATLSLHVLNTYAARPPRPRLLPAVRRLAPDSLRRIRDYIEAHLDRDLTLEELGRAAQFSPNYLARLFRNATGQPLHQYVTASRLAKAKTLVETTTLPLHEIAHQVGLADQSHLSRLFRKTYGYTPGDQRRRQRRS